MKKLSLVADDDVLVRNLTGFLSRAAYLRSQPGSWAEVSAENSPAEQLCEAILARANGVPRQHVIAALVVVIGEFMDEWREEEQLLSGPVQ